MTAVADAASAATAMTEGSNLVSSGTASPAAGLDVLDGNLIGSIYVETDTSPDEPYVCVNNATGAAIWQSMANDVVLYQQSSTTLTSAGQTLSRMVAPFAGRVTAFRAIVLTAATGATDKLVRLVVSGNTIGSGTLTLGDGDAIGTRYGVSMTTDNAITAGQGLTIQSGAQPCATGVFNFYVVCRKMIG
jgi:hypothetical protein